MALRNVEMRNHFLLLILQFLLFICCTLFTENDVLQSVISV